ncbi:putative MYND domain protein [Leptodontidium sp. MPI-SDFR-AT-0119]|nr:putative MYND domain protein [Leptodontidium sp. MPI-SDFR-AT-0119]
MAGTTTTPKCATCDKIESDSGTPLKRCAKCQTTAYCSRDCQRAHWKTHKQVCARNAASAWNASTSNTAPGASASTSLPKGLTIAIDKPFHRLNSKTWMHDRPEEDVYKLLIDTYRFRMEDNFNLEGDRNKESLYGGAADGRIGFVRFLGLAESRTGLLPSWWSTDKGKECIALGLGSDNGWSSLAHKVAKRGLIEHYGNPLMPMQLRLFGEQVYGRGPGGQSGEMIIMMQMKAEGGDLISSGLDVSSIFGR